MKKDGIDEEALGEVLKALETGGQSARQINIYSRAALVVLRYLDLTRPGFSRGGAAGELLSQATRNAYPALWKKLTALKVPEVEEKELYLPLKFPKIIKSKWKQAEDEAKGRKGRLVAVYNPKVSAILRYCSKTIPRYKMSAEAARLIEQEISRRYPEVWEKV